MTDTPLTVDTLDAWMSHWIATVNSAIESGNISREVIEMTSPLHVASGIRRRTTTWYLGETIDDARDLHRVLKTVPPDLAQARVILLKIRTDWGM